MPRTNKESQAIPESSVERKEIPGNSERYQEVPRKIREFQVPSDPGALGGHLGHGTGSFKQGRKAGGRGSRLSISLSRSFSLSLSLSLALSLSVSMTTCVCSFRFGRVWASCDGLLWAEGRLCHYRPALSLALAFSSLQGCTKGFW